MKKYNIETNDLLEPEKIVSNFVEINKDKFIINNCLIYITPDQKKAELGNIKNKLRLNLQ